MKPLTIVTCYNRLDLTKRMLESLEPELPNLDVVIVDNGSSDGTPAWLDEWANGKGVFLVTLSENIGCPKALNLALRRRRLGQAVIKLDNDILLPERWLDEVLELEASQTARGHNVGMISAYWQPWEKQRVLTTGSFKGKTLYHVWPVIGHAVYHSGAFMDRVGYFDVLTSAHLYGFEDLLMSHKAAAMGRDMLAWKGWTIENIQRRNALGRKGRNDHVEAMRPYYNQRVMNMVNGGPLHCDRDGQPVSLVKLESAQ